MKKLALATLVMAVAVSGAFAFSVQVPFWVDSAGLMNPATGAPAPNPNGGGSAGFIGIKNATSLAGGLQVTLRYFTAAGSEYTGFSPNTFTLAPLQGLGFRPAVDDTAGEGPGAAVPPKAAGLPFNVGSVSISWSANTDPVPGAAQVVGRYLEIHSNGQRSAYLLPPGA